MVLHSFIMTFKTQSAYSGFYFIYCPTFSSFCLKIAKYNRYFEKYIEAFILREFM